MSDEETKRRELATRVIENVIERLVDDSVRWGVRFDDYKDAAYKVENAIFKLVKDND